MPLEDTYTQPHGTRAALDNLAATNTLVPWQVYAIDNEAGRLAIATAPNSYETMALQSEAGGGGGEAIPNVVAGAPISDPSAIWPPASEGGSYIVGPGATGDFAGHDNEIATFDGSAWSFAAPTPGFRVWDTVNGIPYTWSNVFSQWTTALITNTDGGVLMNGVRVVGTRQAGIPYPGGVTSAEDSEARAAIGQIIAALMSHGLIE